MSSKNKINSATSNLFLVASSTIIIILAIVLTATVATQTNQTFSQIIVVGPVWSNDSWTCTSDADFIIHGTLRGLDNSQIEIKIKNIGTQSLYTLNPGELESFSIGSQANNIITITRTGTVTGFLTLQTMSGAEASCVTI